MLKWIKLRCRFDSILDFEQFSNGVSKNLKTTVIGYIANQPLEDVMSFNTAIRKHFLTEAI